MKLGALIASIGLTLNLLLIACFVDAPDSFRLTILHNNDGDSQLVDFAVTWSRLASMSAVRGSDPLPLGDACCRFRRAFCRRRWSFRFMAHRRLGRRDDTDFSV